MFTAAAAAVTVAAATGGCFITLIPVVSYYKICRKKRGDKILNLFRIHKKIIFIQEEAAAAATAPERCQWWRLPRFKYSVQQQFVLCWKIHNVRIQYQMIDVPLFDVAGMIGTPSLFCLRSACVGVAHQYEILDACDAAPGDIIVLFSNVCYVVDPIDCQFYTALIPC